MHTSINPTEPTTASEQTSSKPREAWRKPREAWQEERPCSSRATKPANDTRKPDETPLIRIAFTRNYGVEPSYQNNIWVMNDGCDKTPLTKAGGLNEIFPAWSPDGKRIAFETTTDVYVGFRRVYVIDADCSDKTFLAETPATTQGSFATPSWSPDGKKIAFTADDGIHVINVDGTGETQLTENPGSLALGWSTTWQPNGEKIAFLGAGNSDNNDVYTINADGSGQTRLTKTAQDEGYLTWSPDGKKLAFARDILNEPEPVYWDIWDNIYIMSADGTGQTRLSAIDAVDSFVGGSLSIVFVPEGRR